MFVFKYTTKKSRGSHMPLYFTPMDDGQSVSGDLSALSGICRFLSLGQLGLSSKTSFILANRQIQSC